MAYMILEPSQEYLEPREIVRRVEKVFAEVDANVDTGNRFLADRVEKLERIKESLRRPPVILTKQIEMLKELRSRCYVAKLRNHAEDAPIKVTLVPNEPVLISYPREAPLAACCQCVVELAKAIDYKIEMLPDVESSPSAVKSRVSARLADRWKGSFARIVNGARHQWAVAKASCLALVS